MPRIISGENRGMILATLNGDNTRPTADRVKESIFNMINFDIQDCTFLDLFSGSGQMGIEAIARGAKIAHFVEKNDKAMKIVKQNIIKARFEDRALTYSYDAMSFLESNKEKIDIIYIDPPYFETDYDNLLQKISDKDILESFGKIFVEHDIHVALSKKYDNIIKIKEKKYGRVCISIFTKED